VVQKRPLLDHFPFRSTGLDDDDIVETHLAGGGIDGRNSANLPTVSLTSAESPLGCESGLQNPLSEQLETATASASVRQLTAVGVSRSSRRDRQQDRSRDDPQFIRDVRESVIAACKGKTPRRGLEEAYAGRQKWIDTDENLMTGWSPDP